MPWSRRAARWRAREPDAESGRVQARCGDLRSVDRHVHELKAIAPVCLPGTDLCVSAQNVVISTATPSATIRKTTDSAGQLVSMCYM